MRVGFDTSLLPPTPGAVRGGLERVVRESLAALEERAVLEPVRLAPATPLAGRALRQWRGRALPRAVRDQGLVGIHSFTSSFPLRGPGRRAQTVHELPWEHGVAENAGWKHRAWARAGMLRADRVVCGTEFVAARLRARRWPGTSRVRVCPWGVGPPFADEPAPGTVDELVYERYRLPGGPFAVCPGAVRPKKNLAATLRGLARLHERGRERMHLIVTGPETPQLRRDLGLASQLGLARFVLTPGVIDEVDFPALLRLATVVPFLSHSEGFGLPVLEALACGTPVVVPVRSAPAEVAGAAGFAVDPSDPDAVADALVRALTEREALRYALPERAAEFPWTRTAACIEALWAELA